MFALALKGLLWAGASAATSHATSALTEAAIKAQFQSFLDKAFTSWEWDPKTHFRGGSLAAVNLVVNSETLNPLLAGFGIEMIPGRCRIDSLRLSVTLGALTLFAEPWEVEVLDFKLVCKMLSAEQVAVALKNLNPASAASASAALGRGGGGPSALPPSSSFSSAASLPCPPPLRGASTSQATPKGVAANRASIYERVFPLLTAFENLRVTARQVQVTLIDANMVESLPAHQLHIKLGKVILRTTNGPPEWQDTFHKQTTNSKVFKVVTVEDIDIVSDAVGGGGGGGGGAGGTTQEGEGGAAAVSSSNSNSSRGTSTAAATTACTLMRGVGLTLYLTKTRKEDAASQGVAGFLGSAYEARAHLKGSSQPYGTCQTCISIKYDDRLDGWDLSVGPIEMDLKHSLGPVELRDIQVWAASFSALASATAPELEVQLMASKRWLALEHAAYMLSQAEAMLLGEEVKQLKQWVSNLTKAEATRTAATQSLLQGLRQARMNAPGGDYDPAPMSPSDTFYEELLDEVEKRLVVLLPMEQQQQELLKQSPALPGPSPTPSQQQAALASTAAVAVSGQPGQPGQQAAAGWKEAAGRSEGKEGYKFGDFSRSLFKKLG